VRIALAPVIRHSPADCSEDTVMKSILLPTDQSSQMPSALETARLVASMFDSTIEGVALRPIFAEVVAPDPIVAVTIPPTEWDEDRFCQATRATFDNYATGHPPGQAGGARFRWRGGRAVDDGAIGMLARVFDLTVMERPGPHGSRMTALESVLFDSGRPILMAPPAPPRTLGETVLIHWNQSTETSRAIALSMPLLKRAKRVLVLTVEGNVVSGPSGKEVVGYLSQHGIAASDKTAPKGAGPGETILAEARTFGADLLIKGAFTQSRLRQMIFGGATSHILAAADLPVFLSH
jgi:nucleotide-binding universal stress UspA family protein